MIGSIFVSAHVLMTRPMRSRITWSGSKLSVWKKKNVLDGKVVSLSRREITERESCHQGSLRYVVVAFDANHRPFGVWYPFIFDCQRTRTGALSDWFTDDLNHPDERKFVIERHYLVLASETPRSGSKEGWDRMICLLVVTHTSLFFQSIDTTYKKIEWPFLISTKTRRLVISLQ